MPPQDGPIELRISTRTNQIDFVQKMVQTLMVEFFENSKKILVFGREQIHLRLDFVFKNELRKV